MIKHSKKTNLKTHIYININLFFMKLIVLKICSFSMKPRTLTTIILTILMNLKSLLKIGGPKTLRQNQVNGLKSFSFHMTCS